jgi:hypothetical protein
MPKEMRDWKIKTLGRLSGGKLADSQDSFNFAYVEIDPRKENFSISVSFEVEDASDTDYQSGYGIMAVDTVASSSNYTRHRNSLMVGCFRSSVRFGYSYGARIVGGYTDRDAMPQNGHRRLDASRLFPSADIKDRIIDGDRRLFKLEKTDEGFVAYMRTDSGDETIFVPGCDFLLRQERRAIYVGIAVAGNIKMNITDVIFNTSPGKKSHTPKGTIKMQVPDYPFNRNHTNGLEPFFIDAAPGKEIILPDGVYDAGTYYIRRQQSGTADRPIILRAEHPGKAIIDGSASQGRLPAMILRGSYWVLDGLVFRNAPSCGLFICGSENVVRNCEAYGNGDTGFLICSFPGSSKNGWPKRNRVESCCSHDNCDAVRCNADGFGAKLSIGEGNGFFNCKAFHNIDDGFDLYTKSSIGRIGPVTLEGCVAESNGWLSDEIRPSGDPKTGVGFKLGGEGLKVRHQVRDCVANDNARVGFDANSNPVVQISGCEAKGNEIDYRLSVPSTDWYSRFKERVRLFLARYDSSDEVDQFVLRELEAIVPNLANYSRHDIMSFLCLQALGQGFGSLQEYYSEVASNQKLLKKLVTSANK